ncbi:hypothetical protein AWB75_07157 [Caballeronia catudaia]|uniref:Uncharacterized protein n=1 Tax=Caballeronia catudaia TaxID=1777136 RepID=A0A158DTM6_9BURK|nr:hypothetical protein [Caballeronia catudaia]SAK97924.1 hypothetical protein AWB75_07157 [Caballeronia catudaia]
MSLGRNVVRVRHALRWTARKLAAETVRDDPVRLKKAYRAIAQMETRGRRNPDRLSRTRLLPALADALKIAPSRLMYDDLCMLSDAEIFALRATYGQARAYDESRPIGDQVETADLLQRSVIRMVLKQCRTDEELIALKLYLLAHPHIVRAQRSTETPTGDA